MAQDVFIAYSHKDKSYADKILQAYENEGIRCWISPRDIVPGCNWATEVKIAVEESKVFVLIFSSNADTSQSLLREVELATINKLLILPVRIEDIKPSGGMMYYLSTLHWVNMVGKGFERELPSLLKTTKNILSTNKTKDTTFSDIRKPKKIGNTKKENVLLSLFKRQPKNNVNYSLSDNSVFSGDRFEAYRGSKPYMFISYSHRDSDIIMPIISSWHKAGYRIWYDEGIDPGNEWREDIAKALSECSYFVIFISKDSVKSKNVKKELYFAESNDKQFLAVYIEDTKLTPGMKLTIDSYQAIMKYKMSINDFNYKISKTLSNILK